MKRSGTSNLLEDCRSLDTFDFTPWKEDQRSQGRTYYRVETEGDQSKVMVMHGNTSRVETTLEEVPGTTMNVSTSTESFVTTTLTPDITTTTSSSTIMSNQTNAI